MRFLNTANDPPDQIRAALTQGNSLDLPEVEAAVRGILAEVRTRGDAGLRDCVRRYSGADLDQFEVPPAEWDSAAGRVSAAFRRAVETALENLRRYHSVQVPRSWEVEEGGARLGQRVRPLDRVGILVPAGKAPLPSTLLMAAVPARAAGVPELIVSSPPAPDGSVDPHTLYAAQRAGVDRFFRLGGAHGVAALAYGTASVPRVDKIVGPGGPYTVIAKRLVFGHVDIESLPGPTEVLVIADDSANPTWIAADLLSQAEHGADSLAVLLTPSAELGRAVAAAVERQIPTLSRAETIRQCLREHGWVILTRDLAEACALSNECAPEHLELLVADPDALLDRIHHAGAVFVGPYTPEPIGDYVAGPSHILPTGGTARFSSPLHVDDFVKKSSLLCYSRERFEREAGDVICLAEAETLDAHAAAIRIRLPRGCGPGPTLE